MTIDKALHPKADAYPKTVEEEWLALKIVWKWKDSLKKYIENSSERLLKAVEGKRILGDGKTKKEILKKRENFINKSLHS